MTKKNPEKDTIVLGSDAIRVITPSAESSKKGSSKKKFKFFFSSRPKKVYYFHNRVLDAIAYRFSFITTILVCLTVALWLLFTSIYQLIRCVFDFQTTWIRLKIVFRKSIQFFLVVYGACCSILAILFPWIGIQLFSLVSNRMQKYINPFFHELIAERMKR